MAVTRRIYLVQCVSGKQSRAMPARDLYRSDWFAKARAYVEAQGTRWFILSGKYELLRPDRHIGPYNITLNRMKSDKRRAWADRVLRRLKRHCRSGDRIIFLAGERYREHLIPELKKWGCSVRVPMQGLAIGEEKQWLQRQI